MTPPKGKTFLSSIMHILERERNWVSPNPYPLENHKFCWTILPTMQKSLNYIDVDLNCLYGEVLGTYVSRKASFCFLQLKQMLLHWWQFRVVQDY